MSAAVTSCQRGPARYTATGRRPLAPQQAPDDGAHPVLGDRLLALLGALGRVLEDELPRGHRDVLLLDRGQAEGTVLSAYSSPPGRKKPRSIRRTAAARTRSLVRPRPSR